MPSSGSHSCPLNSACAPRPSRFRSGIFLEIKTVMAAVPSSTSSEFCSRENFSIFTTVPKILQNSHKEPVSARKKMKWKKERTPSPNSGEAKGWQSKQVAWPWGRQGAGAGAGAGGASSRTQRVLHKQKTAASLHIFPFRLSLHRKHTERSLQILSSFFSFSFFFFTARCQKRKRIKGRRKKKNYI